MKLTSIVLGLLPTLASAQDLNEFNKLVAPDAAAFQHFGRAVDVCDDTLIVGAPNATYNGLATGAAYVFVKNGGGWTLQQELFANDGAAGDAFGSSVSVFEDYLVVGAATEDGVFYADRGAAYVFARFGTSWVQQAKFLALDPATNDQFGTSVSIAYDKVLVGAPLKDHNGLTDSGAAFVFTRMSNSWSQGTKLNANDPETHARFGHAVSIWADYAACSAPWKDTSAGTDAGKAYVFERNGTQWPLVTSLTTADPQAGDQFGYALSLHVNTLAASAHVNAGHRSVYVFDRTLGAWSQSAQLVPSATSYDSNFGESVDVEYDQLVVGAPYISSAGGSQGAAFVFGRSGGAWIQRARLVRSDGGMSMGFGLAVAVHSGTQIVGRSDEALASIGAEAGSVYVYRECSDVLEYCTATTSSNGCYATMAGTGIASASASSGFSISVTGLPGQKQGHIFYGITGWFFSPWGAGANAGFKCVVAPTQRTFTQSTGGSSNSCDGSMSLDFNAYLASHPAALGQPFSGLEVVYAQGWYRDPGSVKTTAMTTALRFPVAP